MTVRRSRPKAFAEFGIERPSLVPAQVHGHLAGQYEIRALRRVPRISSGARLKPRETRAHNIAKTRHPLVVAGFYQDSQAHPGSGSCRSNPYRLQPCAPGPCSMRNWLARSCQEKSILLAAKAKFFSFGQHFKITQPHIKIGLEQFNDKAVFQPGTQTFLERWLISATPPRCAKPGAAISWPNCCCRASPRQSARTGAPASCRKTRFPAYRPAKEPDVYARRFPRRFSAWRETFRAQNEAALRNTTRLAPSWRQSDL